MGETMLDIQPYTILCCYAHSTASLFSNDFFFFKHYQIIKNGGLRVYIQFAMFNLELLDLIYCFETFSRHE